MNVLLDPPRTVVCVAGAPSIDDALVSALAGDEVDDVVTVASEDALERIEAASCGCVVVHDGVGSDTALDLCETIRSRDEDLPIVVIVEAGGTDLATEATVAGASATLRSPDTDQIRAVVERHVAAFVRHRTDAEEREILHAMLENLDTPLYAKDEQGRHLELADIRGGEDPERAVGKTDLELYGGDAPEFAQAAYEDDMRVLETETPVFNRDEGQGPPGNKHWSRTTKVPWYGDDGTLKGLVGVSHDITELKQKEARLEEVRDRFEEFASHLSHDLQNPLQVASGYLEMAKTADDPTDALERVEAALERMEEMIDDMSTAASHRGTTDGNETTFPLSDLVDSVWAHLSAGEARLVDELPDDYLVHAQQSELRPLFENLLKNAVEHGSQGDTPTDLTVRVGLTDDGGIYVEDDGPGIPPSKRAELLGSGEGVPANSSGTGLEIVASIATRNDWAVTITESELGTPSSTEEAGARFEIRNCLGVRERTPHDARRSLAISETAEVGDLREPGTAEYDSENDEWVVAGDGEDIWRQHNDFVFAYARVDGPVRIEGQVVDIEHVNEFTKAGLMVRDDLTEDATYGYAGTTPTRGTELLWRTRHAEDGTSQQLAAEPFSVDWYRIDRIGDRVTTYLSTDGQTWDPVDERRIDISDPVYVGLAVSSVVPGVVAEATFRNVSVSTLDV